MKRTVIGTPLSLNSTKVMMLGSGELGKEVVIELQRFGVEVIAVDRYPNAPGMQLAHRSYVINMLDGRELRSVIEKNFPKHPYEISKLENDFGPAVVKGSVQALVVSEKTSNKGSILNELRRKEKLPPVEIVQVSMVLAEDGKAISTTRIKNSEIDSDGNLN